MHKIEHHPDIKRIRVLACTTKWMNLKNIILSKGPRYRSICIVQSHSYEIPEEAKLVYSGRKQISNCLLLGVGRGKLTAKGQWGLF